MCIVCCGVLSLVLCFIMYQTIYHVHWWVHNPFATILCYNSSQFPKSHVPSSVSPIVPFTPSAKQYCRAGRATPSRSRSHSTWGDAKKGTQLGLNNRAVSEIMYDIVIHTYMYMYILYYIILYYILLYYIMLYYITLYYIILYYIILYFILLYNIMLYYITLNFNYII